MYPKPSGGADPSAREGRGDRRATPAGSATGSTASSRPGVPTAARRRRPTARRAASRASPTWSSSTPASPIVVKMAPPGLPPTRNRDVLRQARVQDAIARHRARAGRRGVLHRSRRRRPRCRPCTRWSFVDGESFEPLLDACDELPTAGDHPRAPAGRGARAGRPPLHRHRTRSVSTTSPRSRLPEEVERWVRIFETVSDDLRSGYRTPADALLATRSRRRCRRPSSTASTGWATCSRAATRSLAIIDWELWTREDPRVDLSWFLSYLDADEQPSAIRATPDGDADARRDAGRLRGGGRCARLPTSQWFDAHARFKMAAIAALVNKHNRRRERPDPDAGGAGPADRPPAGGRRSSSSSVPRPGGRPVPFESIDGIDVSAARSPVADPDQPARAAQRDDARSDEPHLEAVRGRPKHDDDVRVVLLTGTGDSFCAGADLSGVDLSASGGQIPPVSMSRNLFLPMLELSKPFVGAINGVAAGGGLGLALCCDIRLGSDDARFATSFQSHRADRERRGGVAACRASSASPRPSS